MGAIKGAFTELLKKKGGQSLKYGSEDWWMERLAVKKTGASEYVVMLRSDGRAVTIDKVLTAASGRDTKQFWNVVAQHQTKGVRDHTLSCERGCSVKSTSPTTENWLRKLCIYSMNNNTSDEDKHDTNYINNKYTNTYTRKLHNQ